MRILRPPYISLLDFAMPDKNQSILLGGLVVAVLSTSYLSLINMICCLGVIVGAVIAVWHYTETNEITVSGGTGATMGVLAALFGLIVASIINFGLIKMGIRHDQVFTEWMINAMGDNMPPEQYDAMVEQMNADITIGLMLKNTALGAIVYVIFGAIGGMIGAKMFKKGGDEVTDFDD